MTRLIQSVFALPTRVILKRFFTEIYLAGTNVNYKLLFLKIPSLNGLDLSEFNSS